MTACLYAALLLATTAPAPAESPIAPLLPFAGTWHWTADNDMGAQKGKYGEGNDQWIVDCAGTVLRIQSQGVEANQPVEGLGVIGWDAPKKRFYWLNISNVHRTPITMLGDFDADRSALIVEPLEVGDGRGGRMKIRAEMELPREGRFELRMIFEKLDGERIGTIVYHYERRREE